MAVRLLGQLDVALGQSVIVGLATVAAGRDVHRLLRASRRTRTVCYRRQLTNPPSQVLPD
jgi:hypothetical protein